MLPNEGYVAWVDFMDTRLLVGTGPSPLWAIRSLGKTLEGLAFRWDRLAPARSRAMLTIARSMQACVEFAPFAEHREGGADENDGVCVVWRA
jgi:hypothetical protein